MTVFELIQKLKWLPQDAIVVTTTCGDGGEYREPATDVVAEPVIGDPDKVEVRLVW